MANSPTRFFGLDIHKEYFVKVGVNAQREVVFGPQRVSNYQLDDWISRVLTPQDAVVLEMTTNSYIIDNFFIQSNFLRIAFGSNSRISTNKSIPLEKIISLR